MAERVEISAEIIIEKARSLAIQVLKEFKQDEVWTSDMEVEQLSRLGRDWMVCFSNWNYPYLQVWVTSKNDHLLAKVWTVATQQSADPTLF